MKLRDIEAWTDGDKVKLGKHLLTFYLNLMILLGYSYIYLSTFGLPLNRTQPTVDIAKSGRLLFRQNCFHSLFRSDRFLLSLLKCPGIDTNTPKQNTFIFLPNILDILERPKKIVTCDT